MSKPVACILAVEPLIFNWLGGKQVIRWSLDRLSDVRGLESVYCVTNKQFEARVRAVLHEDEMEVKVLDSTSARDMFDVLRLLCMEAGFAKIEHLVVVRPMTPFLESARVEECLELVRKGKTDAAVTVTPVTYFDEYAKTPCSKIRGGLSPVLGVMAVKRKVFARSCENWPGSFTTVEVNSIEALEVTNTHRLAMAQALVDGGAL